jgi:hypothetical protein
VIPKKQHRDSKTLEKHEFKELCRRGNIEKDEYDVDRISGIGYALNAKPEGYAHSTILPGSGTAPEDALYKVESTPKPSLPIPEKDSSSSSKKSKKEKKHKHEKKEKKDKRDKREKRRDRDRDDRDRYDRDRDDRDRDRDRDSRERDYHSHKRQRHDSP